LTKLPHTLADERRNRSMAEQRPIKFPDLEYQKSIQRAKEVMKVLLAISVIVGGWGIISALSEKPLTAFLTLLVFVGGPTLFILVLARYPETRLGKVFQDILTFLVMFGGGGRG
jgi:hypothetical protein